MASKSKRARQAAAKAKTKSAWPVILWALAAAFAKITLIIYPVIE